MYITGCNDKKKVAEYKLPDKVEHPSPGELIKLSPMEFLNVTNSDQKPVIVFLEDLEPPNPADYLQINGMVHIPVGEFIYSLDTLSHDKPLYLVCMYGDDSRRLGEKYIFYGYDCYYIDGGMYQLKRYDEEVKKPVK